MKRLPWFTWVIFILLTGLVACKVVSQPSTQPNFILILTDDQDEASLAHMPKVQALLVKQGISFSQAFVTTPLCCPSRASILRGQYSHNHQVLHNLTARGGYARFHELGNETSTLATWLDDAGYETMLIGKYLNGYQGAGQQRDYIPPGWDAWASWNPNPGLYYDYKLNYNRTLSSYDQEVNDYSTDVFSSFALQFLEKQARGNAPFFLYINPLAPHTTRAAPEPWTAIPAPRHVGAFADLTMPLSPSFNEADVSDKARRVRDLPPLTPEQIGATERVYRSRLQSLLAVDDMVEAIVKKLESLGKLDSTYILFTSDNGFHVGEHRAFQGKELPYEEDLHVPFVLRGPGIPPHETRDQLVLNLDIAPTLADLAKATIPSFVDGRSLAPLFLETLPENFSWRQAFLFEAWRNLKDDTLVLSYQGIRTETEKYIAWAYPENETELYDLVQDPYELESLSTSGDDKVNAFAAWLESFQSCQAASCRALEETVPEAVKP
jgi:N-acetylglucosamine-6-sulfatase